MYLASAGGATFAVFWPAIIKLLRDNQPVPLAAVPQARRLLVYLGAGTLIGLVVAALGFATLLGSAKNQELLKATGALAYFTAFTGGFSAGALFEEPLSKR
jgi:hypothetical protein